MIEAKVAYHATWNAEYCDILDHEVMNMSIWKNGILGVVVGDALGCPVQFESREEVARHPVTGMRGYGTFNLPAGSWTDDSSLTLALLESIKRNGGIDYTDIMDNFVK